MWLATPTGYCAWCNLVPGSHRLLVRNENYGLTGGILVSKLPICEACMNARQA